MKGVKGRLLKKLKSFPQVTAGSFHFDIRLPPDPARVFRDLSNRGFSSAKADGVQCEPPRQDPPISKGIDGDPDLRRPPAPARPLSSGTPSEADGPKYEVSCRPAPVDPELPSEIEGDDLDDGVVGQRGVAEGCQGKANVTDQEVVPPAGDPLTGENYKCANGSPAGQPLFRRPRLDTPTLFDPDLLAAFQKAVALYKRACEEVRDSTRPTEGAATAENSHVDPEDDDNQQPPLSSGTASCSSHHPLDRFELRCPPGGAGAVVLYTTSLRGIRKTFEDCSRVRHLLRSLRVAFYERDVSMHAGFREELWAALGGVRIIPPRLFVKGRYVGSADDVVGLHERGELMPLLDGMVLPAGGAVGSGECRECAGFMFLLCSDCRGSRKLYFADGPEATPEQCRRCNENGLVVCSHCSMATGG